MLLTVVLSSRISPEAPTSTILVRSPFATALVTEAISRTCTTRNQRCPQVRRTACGARSTVCRARRNGKRAYLVGEVLSHFVHVLRLLAESALLLPYQPGSKKQNKKTHKLFPGPLERNNASAPSS